MANEECRMANVEPTLDAKTIARAYGLLMPMEI